jgi:hypothetical protein
MVPNSSEEMVPLTGELNTMSLALRKYPIATLAKGK